MVHKRHAAEVVIAIADRAHRRKNIGGAEALPERL
jgi:hypothetical protein